MQRHACMRWCRLGMCSWRAGKWAGLESPRDIIERPEHAHGHAWGADMRRLAYHLLCQRLMASSQAGDQ